MKQYKYDRDSLPRPVLSQHAEWLELYDYAWRTAFDKVDYIDKEGWKPQLTCYPGVGIIWQWDSCFLTMMTNYANGTLTAFNNLDNLYRLQRESDGFIGMAYRVDTEKEAYAAGRINPPLYAWAEWQHYVITGDTSRLADTVGRAEGLYRYIENCHRRPNGLYWFDDPGSSGMDNAPRGEYPSKHLDGSGVCHIDLACQQALTADMLGCIYAVLGNVEKAAFYRAEHERICACINRHHWHEKTGFYYDCFSRDSQDKKVKLINTKTVATAWTLLSGTARGERFERVLRHFLDPQEFNTRIPFASLSRDDLNYDPTGGYWLGSAWPPTDYVLVKAMADNGYVAEAKKAAESILDGMYRVFSDSAYGGIWEAYCPEDYKPATTEDGSMSRAEFVGWGGLMPIPMLIEAVIGLEFHADKGKITFRVANRGDSGLENMLFCGGRVSIVCRGFGSADAKLYVDCEKPITLRVVLPDGERELQIAAGHHCFAL